MYAFDSRVRFSEADHHETITLPGIINYFQDWQANKAPRRISALGSII